MASKRSNKTWTEKQYEESGLRNLHLRIPPRTKALLEGHAKMRGISQAELVTQMVEELEAKRQTRRAARDRREDRQAQQFLEGQARSRILESVLAAYRTLELPVPPDPFAPDLAQVSAAHRRLGRLYHPDRHQGDPEMAARLVAINQAAQLLRNPLGS